ncbi:MAG: DUF3089 domain-containing protein [Pseudomonadota bacterium]
MMRNTRPSLSVALAAACLISACATAIGPPPFDTTRVPAAPEYADGIAWLALPARAGLELSTPRPLLPLAAGQAAADVFFIHPTTYKGNAVMNAPYDASDLAAPLNAPVLIGQLGVFNGCCRMYAPRYRQASLAGLRDTAAFELAYTDVARAFRYFVANHNRGRPFIIASHSQGTGHAIRLLQQEVLQTPLQGRLVAAYLIGGYVPNNFGELGLPTCDHARQTGCVLSYNANQTGRSIGRMLIDAKTYWWKGANKREGQAPAICVNPLTWRQEGAAAREANAGSLPFPKAPFGAGPLTLGPLTPHLTGAACNDGLLDVDIAGASPPGFRDALSILTGSHHLNDYGIFYASLRRNAIDRVDAWQASQAAAVTTAP